MKIEQFFEGVGKYEEMLAWLKGEVKQIPITKEEYKKIISNSTKVFRNSTMADADKLNEDPDARLMLHWIAGKNTKEYLNME